MVNVRRHAASLETPGNTGFPGDRGSSIPRGARFNVLLTEDRERPHDHWTVQLPRLLQPQGIQAFVARTGREAMQVVESVKIHAAVIDVATPADGFSTTVGDSAARRVPRDTAATSHPHVDEGEMPGRPAGRSASGSVGGSVGGLMLLEVFRRLPSRPPVVVVNNITLSPRQAQRLLVEALRLGAFSVVDRPTDLETLLAVMRRVVDRRYHGNWPEEGPKP